jgi:hypothetical protein
MPHNCILLRLFDRIVPSAERIDSSLVGLLIRDWLPRSLPVLDHAHACVLVPPTRLRSVMLPANRLPRACGTEFAKAGRLC